MKHREMRVGYCRLTTVVMLLCVLTACGGRTDSSTSNSTRLDSTFGAGAAGYVVDDRAADDIGNAVALDGSGRIVVAGYSVNGSGEREMALWRYNTNGTLDTTFNSTGLVTDPGAGGETVAVGVAIDSSGRVVASGYSQDGFGNWGMAIWRYTTAGALDTTFNGSGFLRYSSSPAGGGGLAIDASGRILVAGYVHNGANWDAALWRYNADGTPDTTFYDGSGLFTQDSSTGGAPSTDNDIAVNVALDPYNRILMVGYSNTNAAGNQDMTLWRFDSDGAPDTTFNTIGVVRHDSAAGGGGNDVGQSIAFDTSDRIVVTGWSARGTGDTNDDMAIWRFNDDGTLDTTFNSVGFVTSNGAAGGNAADLGHQVVIDSSGHILVAGESVNAAGNTDMSVWRYNATGALDTTFGTAGLFVHGAAAGGTLGDDAAAGLQLDSAGNIVVVGQSTNASGNFDLTAWRIQP